MITLARYSICYFSLFAVTSVRADPKKTILSVVLLHHSFLSYFHLNEYRLDVNSIPGKGVQHCLLGTLHIQTEEVDP
jgi:hypothetical protein